MNDTTSTPDEPDGRGRLATDEQAPEQGNGAGADSASAPADAGGGTNVAPPAQSGESGESGPQPAGAPTESGGVGADPQADSTGFDVPTAQLEIPQRGAASASAPESPAGRALEPEPAPGPIPGPGPEAAVPPPWSRMPGSRDAASEQPAQQPPEEQGGFFDEGPTAFLEPPSHQDDDARGDATSAEAEGAGWSTVRTVRHRPPRQAVLQLKRFDPWSALKLGLVLAVVLFFIWMVAVGVLYGALDGMGVWDRLNGTYADLVSGDTPSAAPLISVGRVLGFAAVIGAINSLLFAVTVTVGAFIYNVSADLVGGIEVTLSERD